MEKKAQEKIKTWYNTTYNDDLGQEIKDDVTFYGLFETLDRHKDVYEYLGENIDGIVRERIFEKLAEIMEVDYNYIYEQWLEIY